MSKQNQEIQNNEGQMVELQTRVAFQEDTLLALNDVVAEQDAYIRALQLQVQSLSKKVDDLSQSIEQRDARGVGAADERPPHY